MRISKQAIAFFRTANNEAASDSERATAQAKLNEYCAKHNVSVDAVADAVANDSLTPTEQRRRANVAAKPAPKAEQPKREAPKPEKPSKPANEAKAADYAQRVELIDALRATVAGLYNGPSLAVRTNPKRYTDGVYSALFTAPKHRTTLDKLTARDESALFLIIKRGERNGSFDPIHLNLDSGIFSRLASVGFIERDGNVYKLSRDAIAHANLAAKRAA